MAERRPIVIVGGRQQEIQHGDKLPVDVLPEFLPGDEDDAEWTPTFIPAGIIYTIPTDTQLLTVAPVKVDGTIVIDGTLVLVGGSVVVDEGGGGGGDGGEVVLVGDVLGAGVGVVGTTLATVNPSTGTFGDATHVAQITANEKGLITGVTSVAITGLGGGGSPTRTTATATTASLANNATTSATPITLGPGYRVLSLTTSRAARVRLYTTVAQQTADLNRPIGVDPLANSGLMLDFVTLGTQSRSLNPLVDGANLEESPSSTIPMTVTNMSGATGTVLVTLAYLRTEQ